MEPEITDVFTANEAMQLLVIHFLYKEHKINLSPREVKHLELSVIDEWELLSPAYRRMLVTKDKLDLLRLMSRNEEYLR